MGQYNRQSQNRSTNEAITDLRLQWINEDLDALFAKLDPRDVLFTYDSDGKLTQVVDQGNSVTITIDRTDFENDPGSILIQEQGDAQQFMIQYAAGGHLQSIVYA